MSRNARGLSGIATLGVLAGLVCALTPSVALAQIPGGSASNSDRWRASFRAAVLSQVRPVMESWQRAWTGQEGASIDEHYSLDAVLAPPGGTLIGGRDQIAEFAKSARGRVAALNASMLDFDASDGLAYLSGTWDAVPADGGVGASGRIVTMLLKSEGTWLIRSQLFAADSLSAPLLPPRVQSGPLPALAQRVASNAGTLNKDYVPRQRRNDAYHELLTMLASVRRAWGEDDVGAIRKLLSDDALIQLPGSDSMSGRVTPADLGNVLGEYGTLNTAELDFEYGGALAYLSGRYFVERTSGTPQSGSYMAVFRNIGSGWTIRALLFL